MASSSQYASNGENDSESEHSSESEHNSEGESVVENSFIELLIDNIHRKHASDDDFQLNDYLRELYKSLKYHMKISKLKKVDPLYQKLKDNKQEYIDNNEELNVTDSVALMQALKNYKEMLKSEIRRIVYFDGDELDEDMDAQSDVLADSEYDNQSVEEEEDDASEEIPSISQTFYKNNLIKDLLSRRLPVIKKR